MTGPWAIIPMALAVNPQVSPQAKALYLYLTAESDGSPVRYSLTRLSAMVGQPGDPETWLAELAAVGYATWTSDRHGGTEPTYQVLVSMFPQARQ